MVTNNDSRTYLISGNSNQYASYNGLALKKGIDESWLSPYETEPDKRILRYADVLLMRAEALIQLNDGRIEEAVSLINEVRSRAGQSVTASTSVIKNYAEDYGVKIKVEPYNGTYSQTDALKMLKFERRVELAMECDRFFDLVRWGEAAEVLNKYYAEEAADCSIYSNASFTKNKNEYLPIPFAQISASNGRYVQNCGNW